MRILLLPPFILVLTIIAMIFLDQYAPIAHLWESPHQWIGIPIIVAGVATALWHARLFKRLSTNINTFKDPDLLVTEGFFRVSRNPMYLGFIVALSGVWILLGSVIALAPAMVFWLITNSWYIPMEEAAMERKFGEQYRVYKQKTPRWF